MARTTLQTLPAELRNKIYELAFTCNAPDETTDLCTSRLPDKALTLVCRQSYNEASSIYRDSYRRFWAESQFTITTTTPKSTEAAKKSLGRFRPYDIAQITNLHISTHLMEITWHSSSGLWLRKKENTLDPPCHIAIVWRDLSTRNKRLRDKKLSARCKCSDKEGSTLPMERVPLQTQIQHVLDFEGSFYD